VGEEGHGGARRGEVGGDFGDGGDNEENDEGDKGVADEDEGGATSGRGELDGCGRKAWWWRVKLPGESLAGADEETCADGASQGDLNG